MTQPRDASATPTEPEIRAQLERIVATELFQQAGRSREFLRFVVEQTLAGRGDRLKGYSIAVEVFNRPTDFDAQGDPLVRVEAGRLRQRLREYYNEAGVHDPVVITLPRGGYVPEFRSARTVEPAPTSVTEPAAPPPKATGYRRWQRVACGALLVVAAAAAWRWVTWPAAPPEEPSATSAEARDTRPRLAVSPLENLSGGETLDELAAALTEELLQRLGRFPHFFATVSPPWDETSAAPVADYVLGGTIRVDGDRLRLTARLISQRSNEQLWSETYEEERRIIEDPGLQLVAVREIVKAALPYGPMFEAELARVEAIAPELRQTDDCVLVYYNFRRSFASRVYEEALSCFERAVSRSEPSANAWGGLALLHLDAYGFTLARAEPSDALAMARRYATVALGVDAANFLARLALVRWQFFSGDPSFVESAELLLADFPDSASAHGVIGTLYILGGDSSRGLVLLDTARELSPRPPPLYYFGNALAQLVAGDADAALGFAQRLDAPEWYATHVVTAAAAGLVGNEYAARYARGELLRLNPALVAETGDMFQRWRANDTLHDALVRGLMAAGLDVEPP